jgi:hypothetical protein
MRFKAGKSRLKRVLFKEMDRTGLVTCNMLKVGSRRYFCGNQVEEETKQWLLDHCGDDLCELSQDVGKMRVVIGGVKVIARNYGTVHPGPLRDVHPGPLLRA